LPGNLDLGHRSKTPLILTAVLVPIGGILCVGACVYYCYRVRKRQILRMDAAAMTRHQQLHDEQQEQLHDQHEKIINNTNDDASTELTSVDTASS
jgi:uncharacterized protein HemX